MNNFTLEYFYNCENSLKLYRNSYQNEKKTASPQMTASLLVLYITFSYTILYMFCLLISAFPMTLKTIHFVTNLIYTLCVTLHILHRNIYRHLHIHINIHRQSQIVH